MQEILNHEIMKSKMKQMYDYGSEPRKNEKSIAEMLKLDLNVLSQSVDRRLESDKT